MEAGSYGYGLNMVLAARVDALANNSKRVERDFMLTSIASIFSNQLSSGYDDGIAFILGTENQDWFADYIIASTIFGDGALPHFLPEPQFITRGDFIVAKARNLTSAAKRVALLFQGYHI